MSTPPTVRQHLIDPEICIRCNTCEETCPTGAISHDGPNYVVSFETCQWCRDCIEPCPTGAIDQYRLVLPETAYTAAQQQQWETLPSPLPPQAIADTTTESSHSA